MVDASLDGKKGENVILKQPSYRFESCPDYLGLGKASYREIT